MKQLDATILDILFDENAGDETCDKEAEEANDIQEKISFDLVYLDKAIKEIDNDAKSNASSTGLQRIDSEESVLESVKSDSTAASSPRISAVRVKLPKLEIKKFNGKLQEWNEFWEQSS